MVLILLKAPLVSLVITIVSVVAELALLAAVLAVNRHAECRSLRRGQRLSVRKHRLRTRLIALGAMLVFVGLEITTSLFSEPQVEVKNAEYNCVRTLPYSPEETEDKPEALAVNSKCMEVDGKVITQTFGNFSLETKQISCSDEAAYSFTAGNLHEADLSNGVRACFLFEDVNRETCAVSMVRNGKLSISQPVTREQMVANVTEAKVGFDARNELKGISEAVLLNYVHGVFLEVELWRRVLTNVEESKCVFQEKGRDATSIPLSVIIVTSCLWGLSILVFLCSIVFRKGVFYDLGDPVHWAEQVVRSFDEVPDGNPHVVSRMEGGERRVFVSGSFDAEENEEKASRRGGDEV